MNKDELLSELEIQILEELEFCNRVDTPYLCTAIFQTNSKKLIVRDIMNLVASQGLTIGQAIVLLEQELNPKYS